MVNVATQHGMCGRRARLWLLGIVLGPVFHRYQEGYRSAKLAVTCRKHGFIAYRQRSTVRWVSLPSGHQPIATALDFNRAAFRAASERGDLTYACYSVDRAVLIFSYGTIHSTRYGVSRRAA